MQSHPNRVEGIAHTIEPYGGFWIYATRNTQLTMNSELNTLINNIPAQEVNETERADLLHMREEEKLARDVYLTLYNRWGLVIFRNIARSEQRHMDAIKTLLDRYNIPDPVEATGDRIGVFQNQHIQELYYELVEAGNSSIVNALRVGATIEDLDIKDLEDAYNRTDNRDIKTVYENLMRGSRNHLRAFVGMLREYGSNYTCQYITQEECEQILSTPMETGAQNNQNAYGQNNNNQGNQHQNAYGQNNNNQGNQHQNAYGQNNNNQGNQHQNAYGQNNQ